MKKFIRYFYFFDEVIKRPYCIEYRIDMKFPINYGVKFRICLINIERNFFITRLEIAKRLKCFLLRNRVNNYIRVHYKLVVKSWLICPKQAYIWNIVQQHTKTLNSYATRPPDLTIVRRFLNYFLPYDSTS
eukprot:NODE_23_length_42016_cov_0.755803.p31 type:complete len:131 gc:universal NODE_23_length_42016_cov_0.755803:857-1249(+)